MYRSAWPIAGACVLVLAACGRGQDVRSTGTSTAYQSERDVDLISALADNAVMLAEEKDDLQRAERCLDVTQTLAEMVRRGAASGLYARSAQLANQIEGLLNDGVTANIRSARSMGISAQRQKRIDEIALRATTFCDQLRSVADKLQPSDGPEIRQALDGVARARIALEQALAAPPK